MAYNTNRTTNTITVPGGQLVDVSAASISYSPVTAKGRIINIGASISAAVTGSDTTVTVKTSKAGVTAVAIGTIVIAVSGSAAGSVFQGTITGSEYDCTVDVGDTIIYDSDGVSSTTSIANFSATIRGS